MTEFGYRGCSWLPWLRSVTVAADVRGLNETAFELKADAKGIGPFSGCS